MTAGDNWLCMGGAGDAVKLQVSPTHCGLLGRPAVTSNLPGVLVEFSDGGVPSVKVEIVSTSGRRWSGARS